MDDEITPSAAPLSEIMAISLFSMLSKFLSASVPEKKVMTTSLMKTWLKYMERLSLSTLKRRLVYASWPQVPCSSPSSGIEKALEPSLIGRYHRLAYIKAGGFSRMYMTWWLGALLIAITSRGDWHHKNLTTQGIQTVWLFSEDCGAQKKAPNITYHHLEDTNLVPSNQTPHSPIKVVPTPRSSVNASAHKPTTTNTTRKYWRYSTSSRTLQKNAVITAENQLKKKIRCAKIKLGTQQDKYLTDIICWKGGKTTIGHIVTSRTTCALGLNIVPLTPRAVTSETGTFKWSDDRCHATIQHCSGKNPR